MIKLLYTEWRILRIPVIIGLLFSLAAGLVCLYYRNHELGSLLALSTGTLIPFLWLLILFESFPDKKETLPLITAMPVSISRVYFIKIIPRLLIIGLVTVCFWYFINLFKFWENAFPAMNLVRHAVYKPAMLIAGVIAAAGIFTIGSLIKFGGLISFPLIGLFIMTLICQMAAPVVFVFTAPRNYMIPAAIQFAVVLILGGLLVWRELCLNLSGKRALILCLTCAALLPCLEWGASSLYWLARSHYYQQKLLNGKSLVLSGRLLGEIKGGRSSYNSLYRDDLVRYLLSALGYRPDSRPLYPGVVNTDYSLRWHLRFKLQTLYSQNKRTEFFEALRQAWFLTGFDQYLFYRCAARKNIKPDWFKEMITMLEELINIEPERRLVICPDEMASTLLYYDFDSDIIAIYGGKYYNGEPRAYQKLTSPLLELQNCREKTKILCDGYLLLDEANKQRKLRYYNHGLANLDKISIKCAIDILKLRLYQHEHGEFPESWTTDPMFKYQRTSDGFLMKYSNNNVLFKYPSEIKY